MSRAQWLAFGPLALAGCNANVQATNDADTRMAFDANVSPTTTVDANTFEGDALVETGRADATVDDAADDGERTADSSADVVSTSEAAAYQDATLDAAVIRGPDACVFLDPSPYSLCCDPSTEYYNVDNTYSGGPRTCVSFDHVDYSDANCGASHTCSCLNNSGACSGSCRCSEDDAGRVNAYWPACYGAPPARLERLASAA